jgi:hypothetical protein
MGYIPQQIGWSQEAILLQRILKQLINITKVAGKTTPATTTTTTTL